MRLFKESKLTATFKSETNSKKSARLFPDAGTFFGDDGGSNLRNFEVQVQKTSSRPA